MLSGCSKDLQSTPSATAVQLEAAASQGQSPWTSSVAQTVDLSAVTPLDATSTGPAGQAVNSDGSQVGIYGGTNVRDLCDQSKLVSYLAAEPTKAKAWGQVLGINDQAAYIASLHQVVLMRDAMVTDHGFVNGQATSFPAVLQSGTAVLVDSAWVPRVRCASGSPLTPSAVTTSDDVSYAGSQWPGFATSSVVALSTRTEHGAGWTQVAGASATPSRTTDSEEPDVLKHKPGETPLSSTDSTAPSPDGVVETTPTPADADPQPQDAAPADPPPAQLQGDGNADNGATGADTPQGQGVMPSAQVPAVGAGSAG